MIRALIVEPSGGLWGSERALIDLIEAASGMDVAVCCPPGTPLQAELKKRGVRVLPYFIADLHLKPRWRRLQAALGVLRAGLSFRPDVVHLNQSGVFRVTLPAAVLLGLPITCHVRIFEDAAYLARQRPHPRRLKGIIAISGAIEEELRGFRDLSTIPIHRIYDAYAPVPKTRTAAQTERVRNRIACVGRLVPIKGQEVLLRALGRSGVFRENVECLFVGEGQADYAAQLKEIGPTGGPVQVKWLGFVNDVAPLLQTCRLLICPSHREPLGRVILEAWDAGCVPVAFSGSGGAAEIMSAADGGFLYEEQTPECLAETLAAALGQGGAEADRLIQNGRKWMKEHCSLEAYGRAVVAVLTGASKFAEPERPAA